MHVACVSIQADTSIYYLDQKLMSVQRTFQAVSRSVTTLQAATTAPVIWGSNLMLITTPAVVGEHKKAGNNYSTIKPHM